MKNIKLFFAFFAFAIFSCSNDSDNSSPQGSIDGTGGSLAIFALSGNYLYTVDNEKLNVFSLLNETTPVKVNDVAIGWNIETLFSNGEYLFVGSRTGMYIYSIENPETPVLLSQVQHFTACDPVVSNGNNSFVTLHSNTNCGNNLNVLNVYDTSDLNSPVLIHTRNLVAPKGLGLYNNYLFICDDVIKIFDITDPANPVLAKSLDVNSFDVIIKGNELYAIGDSSLSRYSLDSSNIQNIILQSEINF